MTRSDELLWRRWDEVDRLLAEALTLPPGEREAFLHGKAGDDPALLDLLLRLAARAATDHARVSTPAESIVASAFGGADEGPTGGSLDLAAGTVVGRYVVVRRRARGGMATVYEAERNDGAYEQRVALKVLRRGLDTEDLVRRFLMERQILSSLSHPNIARLLDGGSTADGRPFLVMELVEGQPITAYADELGLDVQSRLELFLGVADAVHAAHRQLVVHRDIKPSNILVDGDGRVKLLDFGIAKLLTNEGGHTEVGQRALTPEYASPEQIRGEPITTATDVYQLGLLLRKLLSVGPASRGRSGELGIIVAKSLRAEPEQRYASVDELASDVRRHLQGLPILAHPESLKYRVRKFTRRHLAGVSAAAIGVLLLVGYAVTVTVQSSRIASERDRAELEALKAQRVSDFLVQLFRSADPNERQRSEMTARQLLDAGARQLDQELTEEPFVRAAMLSAIGRSYEQLGLYDEARRHLERAVEERRRATGTSHDAHARDLNSLALVMAKKDLPAALSLFREALDLAESQLGTDHPLVARILTDYSVYLFALTGRDSLSEGMLERAIDILRAAPGDMRGDLSNALTVYARGKKPEVSIPLSREALDLRRAIHGERHTMVAASLNDLALVTEPADPMTADSLMTEALDMLLAIHGPRHGLTLNTMRNLAALRRDRGAFGDAEPLYREVLALRGSCTPTIV